MMKEFSRRKFLKLTSLLVASTALKCAARKELKKPEKDLLNLENDFSRKNISVDVYADDEILLNNQKSDIHGMMNYTKNFYDKININLDVNIVDNLDISLLKPAERIGIEILPFEKFYWKNIEKGLYPNNVMFSLGATYIKESIILIRGCEFINDRTKLLAINHEIGHILGLFHPTKFGSWIIENEGELDKTNFSDFQKAIVHSYLEKGKIYKQLEEMDFNFDKYSEMMRKLMNANNHNNF